LILGSSRRQALLRLGHRTIPITVQAIAIPVVIRLNALMESRAESAVAALGIETSGGTRYHHTNNPSHLSSMETQRPGSRRVVSIPALLKRPQIDR
jgi:hypothetical protein